MCSPMKGGHYADRSLPQRYAKRRNITIPLRWEGHFPLDGPTPDLFPGASLPLGMGPQESPTNAGRAMLSSVAEAHRKSRSLFVWTKPLDSLAGSGSSPELVEGSPDCSR